MAIGTLTKIGGVSSNDNTSQTLAVSLSPSIQAGDHVFVTIASDDPLTGVGVSDAGSNTYAQVGSSVGTPGTHGVQSNFFHAHATTTAATVTLDKGAAGNRPTNVQVFIVTGIASSSALDQTANAVFATGTSHAVGPTGTTAQADEIVIVLNGLGDNVTVTPNAGYTNAGSVGGDLSGANGIPKQYVSSKIVSATGTQSATETLSGSAGAAMIIATFKAAAGGTPATVTAVAAVALGSAPAASVSAGGGASVTAVPATASGSAPVASVSGGATVTAPAATALGSAPPANNLISIVVGAPAVVALGSAPAAAVSAGGTGASVGAVAAVGAGSAPAASVSAGVAVTAVVADALGSAPVASLAAGVTVTAAPAVAAGAAPRPAITPTPAGGVSGDVAATFAEASS